ncbi:MAG: hypothetical protein KC621_21420, partial [Myxococcales bacterium]|nr:hypothetical protein [Myxococcales bacterium]
MLLLLWMGCQGGGPTDGPADAGDVVGTDGSGQSEQPGVVDPSLPLGAKLTFLGATEIVPRTLSIQLDRPVFGREQVGGETKDFTVTLDPPVDGTLAITGERSLEWTPATPLRPGTTYQATVARASTPEGELEAGPWTAKVDTPAFALLRTTLRRQAPPGGNATIDLVFSAPPAPDTLKKAVTAMVDGSKVELGFEPGEGATVSATLRRPPTGGDELVVAASDQVAWVGDAKLRATKSQATLSLASGPRVDIEEVFLREGASGWYFEVVCDDDAAPGEQRWRWLPGLGSWDLSTRCQLDETFASRMVHTDPPVPLSFAPGLGGFRVFGDLPRGKMKLTIDGGTTTIDGGMLRDTWEHTYEVKPRTPTVAFDAQGRYLPRSAWKSLTVRHLNVDRLDVEVRHVPEEDLVFWMTGAEPTTARTSNRVAKSSITVRNTADQEVVSTVSVASLVPDPKPGVYEINVRGGGQTASSRILLTDLHLVAKADQVVPGERFTPRIHVWGLDVHTGVTRDDVTVRAVRASGAVMATCEAKGDRGCELLLPQDDIDDNPPVALIATRGDDMTYLEFTDLHLDLPTDVGGRPYTASSPYDAPMWTDRGVYRPGDTAHVAALVRTAEHVAPPADLPVLLRVFDPKERETRKRVVATNAAGMVTTDLPFGDYASTGRYRVVAEVGDEQVGETTFQVEEFVPERLAVKATPRSEGSLPNEPVDIEVSGQWLFGGSAEGSGVELTCNLVPSTYAPPNYDGWSFGPAWLTTRPSAMTLGTVHGELDDKGLSTVTCPAATSAVQGPMQLVAQASVFEGESGRTTVGEARVPVHPEKFWIGLDSSVTKSRAGQPVPLKGVILDWKGQPTKGKRKVTVETVRMEEEYGWWWDEEEGSQQQRTLRPAREETRELEVVDGTFSLEVTPKQDAAGL